MSRFLRENIFTKQLNPGVKIPLLLSNQFFIALIRITF